MRSRRTILIVAEVFALAAGCGDSTSDASSGTSTDAITGTGSGTESSGGVTSTTGATTTGATTTDETTTGETTTGETATTTGGPPLAKRVFLTAATFHGDLKSQGAGVDGVDGADRLCAAAATTATLGGTWVAWVSASDLDALSRLPVDGRWLLIDESSEVFASRGAIQFGPEHAIDMTETGATLPDGETVWTNTDRFGKSSNEGQNNACDDWRAQTGSAAVGVLFDPDFGGPGLSWTDTHQPQACGGEHHLYCFEV